MIYPNKLSNDYVLSSVPLVENICSPFLENMCAHDFNYFISYPNGSLAGLGTCKKMIKDWLDWLESNYVKCRDGIMMSDILPYGHSCFMQADIPQLLGVKFKNIKFKTENILRYLNVNWGVVNRLMLVNKTQSYVECFCYAFTKDTLCNSVIMNNLQAFRYFNMYFTSEAKALINTAIDHPALPPYKSSSAFVDADFVLPLNVSAPGALLHDLPIKKIYLENNDLKSTYLTRKELVCVKQLMVGFSAREIAERNYISKRTVEKHIGNIKEKLGVTTRSEMVGELIEKGLANLLLG